jgi:hypothetical protein
MTPWYSQVKNCNITWNGIHTILTELTVALRYLWEKVLFAYIQPAKIANARHAQVMHTTTQKGM